MRSYKGTGWGYNCQHAAVKGAVVVTGEGVVAKLKIWREFTGVMLAAQGLRAAASKDMKTMFSNIFIIHKSTQNTFSHHSWACKLFLAPHFHLPLHCISVWAIFNRHSRVDGINGRNQGLLKQPDE